MVFLKITKENKKLVEMLRALGYNYIIVRKHKKRLYAYKDANDIGASQNYIINGGLALTRESVAPFVNLDNLAVGFVYRLADKKIKV